MKVIIKILLIILAFLLFYNCHSYPFTKQEATQMAKDYLLEKYEQEMKYLFTNATFHPDRNSYVIYFSPIGNDEIRFRVRVRHDLSFTWDNYLLVRFKEYSKNYFREEMKDIWPDSNMKVWVITNYEHRILPVELNENMDPAEIKYYIDITFMGIDIDCILDDTNVEKEAINILKALDSIKRANYKLENFSLHFSYKTNKSTPQNLVFYFEHWETMGYDNILEILNKELLKD